MNAIVQQLSDSLQFAQTNSRLPTTADISKRADELISTLQERAWRGGDGRDVTLLDAARRIVMGKPITTEHLDAVESYVSGTTDPQALEQRVLF